MFVGGNGKGRFPKPQPIKRFPSSTGPPLKDMRYTTCQGRNGAVPGRRLWRSRSHSSPVSPAPRTLRPGESRGAQCGRESRGGGSAGPGARTAAGRSPAQKRALAGTGQSRTTRLGAVCSLGAPRIPRLPPLGCFHTNSGGRQGGGGSGGGAGGGGGGSGAGGGGRTSPHLQQRQRGAPPTTRLGQPSRALAQGWRPGGGNAPPRVRGGRAQVRGRGTRRGGAGSAHGQGGSARRRWKGGARKDGPNVGRRTLHAPGALVPCSRRPT